MLVALRENERGARAYGVSAVGAKLTAFAISGFFASIAGVVLVQVNGQFTLGLFPPEENLITFTAAVVGGLGSVLGAVLGAIFLKGGQWFLNADWRLLASGIGVLLVLLLLPGGLSGGFYRLRDLGLRSLARGGGSSCPACSPTSPTDATVDAAVPDMTEPAPVPQEEVPTPVSTGGVPRDPDAPATHVGRTLVRTRPRPGSATRSSGSKRSPATDRCGRCSSSSASTRSTSSRACRSPSPRRRSPTTSASASRASPSRSSSRSAPRSRCRSRSPNVADRGNRVRIALLGGLVFSVFSLLVGLSVTIWMVAFMLAGSQIGKAFIEPSHTSLLADYYEVGLRPRVFSFYRAGNAVGALVGGITAGYIAETFSWRVPFFVFAIPTVLLVLAGATLPEPRRGVQEKKLAGANTETSETEEAPPSIAEAWRMCWQIDSLRRIYRVLPFLTPTVAGFAIFSTFLYRDVFGLDDSARGWVLGLVEGPAQLIGLTVGARLGMKYFARDPKLVFGLLSKAVFIVSGAMIVFAWAPVVWLSIAANVVISACLAFVVPGLFAALSLAIPPRPRSTGFSMASVFVLAGTLTIPVVSIIGEEWGMRWGLTVMVPVFLVAGLVMSSAGDLISRDIMQVWTAAAAAAKCCAAPTKAGPSCCSSRASTSATATCRSCSTSTSKSTRAKSSRCSARTVRGSRRCSRRSAASRPRTRAR